MHRVNDLYGREREQGGDGCARITLGTLLAGTQVAGYLVEQLVAPGGIVEVRWLNRMIAVKV